jgi:hypothetical protein
MILARTSQTGCSRSDYGFHFFSQLFFDAALLDGGNVKPTIYENENEFRMQATQLGQCSSILNVLLA